MTLKEKVYIILCVTFSVFAVLGNLTYQKFIKLEIFSIHTLELSVGIILYPLTFFLTDLITEFYGKIKARLCVKLGISMNVLTLIILSLMDSLNATDWSPLDNNTFHKVFGFYYISFIGSMIACYTAQSVNILLYSWLQRHTGPKWLWLRNNSSTIIALFTDTAIVISFMTFFGVFSISRMRDLIISGYIYKFFFLFCSTPFFYVSVSILQKLKTFKVAQN